MLESILACVLALGFSVMVTVSAISIIQNILESKKDQKRREEQEIRDKEYHNLRMEEMKKHIEKLDNLDK